jgi:hypothetical protein
MFLPIRFLAVGALLLFVCRTHAQPASAPTTAPAASESLLNGAITFTPPPADQGWTLAGKTHDGKTVAYAIGKHAAMAVNVTPQDTALDDSAANKLGPFIIKRTRDEVAKNGAQSIDPPRNEKDDRFFLHIHDRFKKDDQTADRLQVYRVIGKNLVTVATTIWSDDAEETKRSHEITEQVALSAAGPGGVGGHRPAAKTQATAKPKLATTKPATLSQAKLRVTPPAGWTSELKDATSGVVATFHDPQETGDVIAVGVKPLPKEATKDPKLRDAVIDELLSGEKQQFKIEGATVDGASETLKDNRFLKKVRTKYQGSGKRFTVTSRALRVGDAVVSVTSIAIDDAAPTVEQLGDELAVGIRPIR